MKKRITLDDLMESTRNQDNFMVVQDKKTGKPRVVKKKKQEPALLYRHKYPMFFRLISGNPSIPDPVEEHIFHPTRKWRIDICWPDYKLALEIEGGTFLKKGGHRGSISGYLGDKEKYNALAVAGYFLLRFTPQEIETCEAYDVLRDWFKNNDKKTDNDRDTPKG